MKAKKGPLQKFVGRKFKGNGAAMAVDMVIMFCNKYNFAGSTVEYNLYSEVQRAIERALENERNHNRALEEVMVKELLVAQEERKGEI